MILEISDVLEYTPEWNGNRNNSTPITVKYRNPTMALYEQLIPKPKLVMKMDNDGKMQGAESIVSLDNRKIIHEMVTSIQNLHVKFQGREFDVKSGDELFGDVPAVISTLVDELGVFLQKVLTKKMSVADGKNSE
jgi:hypothetical protein